MYDIYLHLHIHFKISIHVQTTLNHFLLYFLIQKRFSDAAAAFQTFPADTPTYLTQENSPKSHILIM